MESLQNNAPPGSPVSTKLRGGMSDSQRYQLMITTFASLLLEASEKAKLGIRESLLLINEPTDCFSLAC